MTHPLNSIPGTPLVRMCGARSLSLGNPDGKPRRYSGTAPAVRVRRRWISRFPTFAFLRLKPGHARLRAVSCVCTDRSRGKGQEAIAGRDLCVYLDDTETVARE